MTVKLIKRTQQTENEIKPPQTPTLDQLMTTARSWVDEFRSNKARNNAALLQLVKSN